MDFGNPIFIGLLWLTWICAPFGIGYWAYRVGRSGFGWGLATFLLSLTLNAFFFFIGPTILPPRLSDTGVISWMTLQALLPSLLMAMTLYTNGPTAEAAYQKLEKKKEKETKALNHQALNAEMELKKASIQDSAYKQAFDEFSGGNVDKPTMVKAIIEAAGDQEKVQSLYLKARSKQLIELQLRLVELSISQEGKQRKDTNLHEEIIDAAGNRRAAKRFENGVIEVETSFGTVERFSSLEEARKYFHG